MKQLIWIFSTMSCFILGCGTMGTSSTMSAQDEARYKAAIERAEVEDGSAQDTPVVIAVGESAAAQASAQMPKSGREFSVLRGEYDAFFAQSPAVILGQMTLEPIVDGGTLLGYRVKNLKHFSGVDLENNDIIVGINDKLPRTPDDYFNAWEQSKNAAQTRVNVQRGLDKFDLVWSVRVSSGDAIE